MSETDSDEIPSSGIKIHRFHERRGEPYGLWNHLLRAACRVKNVWRVMDSSSLMESTDYTESAPFSYARVLAKRERACGIIISALGDAPIRVVMEIDEDPERMI